MKKFKRFAVVAAVVTGSVLAAAPAFAAPPPGSNSKPDHIRNTGSDTTVEMMDRLDVLYTRSVGCALVLGSPSWGNDCAVPLSGTETENFDHDTVVEEYQIGSGNGRTKLRISDSGGSNPDPAIGGARSSDACATAANNVAKENGLSCSSFAKDGLAVVVMTGTKNGVPGFAGTPTAIDLTVAQAERIFSGAGGGCATKWSDIGIVVPGDPAITPYGIQTGSGTYKSFDSLITGDPNACANALTAPGAGGGAGCSGSGSVCTTTRILFENDTAPIDGGTGTDGVSYRTTNDRGTAVWWMSNGTLLTQKVQTGTAKPVKIAGKIPEPGNIVDNTYAFRRYLWHVNRKLDVSYSAPAGSAVGTAASVAPRGVNGNPGFTGVAGAAYNYRAWLCRNGGHASFPKVYNTEITNAISASGFVRVSSSFDSVGVNPITGSVERCVLENFEGNGQPDDKVMPVNWNQP